MDEMPLTPHQRAQITRQRNAEFREKRWQEEITAIRSARLALQRVADDPKSTAEQILQAVQLMVEIGKQY